MSEESQPPEKKTVEIAAVPDWAVKLSAMVQLGFTSVNARLDGLEGTHGTLSNEVGRIRVEVSELRGRQDGILTRVSTSENDVRRLSERTHETDQKTSSADLEQEAKLGLAIAALAEERALREKLQADAATKDDVKTMLDDAAKEQTSAIVTGVQTLIKTPTAQKLKNAIVPVLMAAIAIIGIKLQASMTKLEAASPVTVYVTVTADAGVDGDVVK